MLSILGTFIIHAFSKRRRDVLHAIANVADVPNIVVKTLQMKIEQHKKLFTFICIFDAENIIQFQIIKFSIEN